MKRNTITSYANIFLCSIAAISLSSCDVDKVEDGEMPKVDVDVDADPGKLPKYDVDGPDVDVGTKKVEIEVPTVDVDLPDEGDEGGGDESPADVEE